MRQKNNFKYMSIEEKNAIMRISKKLYANGVNIQRFNKENCVLLLEILEEPFQVIDVFKKYSYEVFIEIIEIQLNEKRKK